MATAGAPDERADAPPTVAQHASVGDTSSALSRGVAGRKRPARALTLHVSHSTHSEMPPAHAGGVEGAGTTAITAGAWWRGLFQNCGAASAQGHVLGALELPGSQPPLAPPAQSGNGGGPQSAVGANASYREPLESEAPEGVHGFFAAVRVEVPPLHGVGDDGTTLPQAIGSRAAAVVATAAAPSTTPQLDLSSVTPRTRYAHVFGRSMEQMTASSPAACASASRVGGGHGDRPGLSAPPSSEGTAAAAAAAAATNAVSALPWPAKRARTSSTEFESPRIGGASVSSPASSSVVHARRASGSVHSNPFSSRNAPAFRYAVVRARGQRPRDEDRYQIVSNWRGHRRGTCYLVCDGHGGAAASQFVAEHLWQALEQQLDVDNLLATAGAAFHATNSMLVEHLQATANARGLPDAVLAPPWEVATTSADGVGGTSSCSRRASAEDLRTLSMPSFCTASSSAAHELGAGIHDARQTSDHLAALPSVDRDCGSGVGLSTHVTVGSTSTLHPIPDAFGVCTSSSAETSQPDAALAESDPGAEQPSTAPVVDHLVPIRPPSPPAQQQDPLAAMTACTPMYGAAVGARPHAVLRFTDAMSAFSPKRALTALDDATTTPKRSQRGASLTMYTPPSRLGGGNTGTTATAILILGSTLHAMNVGDSRAVLVRADASCLPLTVEHTATNGAEAARCCAQGGWVSDDGRLMGRLALTRAFGDANFREAGLIVTPDVRTHELVPGNDVAVVLASDGLWDVLSNDEVAAIVCRDSSAIQPSTPRLDEPLLHHAHIHELQQQQHAFMHTPTPPLADVDARASPGLSGSLLVGGRSRSSSATGMLSPPVRNGGGRPPPAAALPGGPSIMLTEPRTIAERLLAEAHLRGAKDNVTIMVIDLTRPTCGFTSAPSATDLAAHGWAEQGSSRSPASFVAPGVSPTPHHT